MKTGDKVIVPAEINGYGRDLRAIITEIEKLENRKITCPFRNLCSFLASSGVPDLPPAASFWE